MIFPLFFFINCSYFEQVPLTLFTIIINTYCIVTVFKTKELQNLDYFLTTCQSLIDLVFTGFFGLVFYLFDLYLSLYYTCAISRIVEPITSRYFSLIIIITNFREIQDIIEKCEKTFLILTFFYYLILLKNFFLAIN